MKMKKYLIFLLIMFLAGSLIASEESTSILGKGKTNLIYSPFAYNHFTGSISGINDDYGFKKQFAEVPVKRIGIESFVINSRSTSEDYLGLFIYMSHNRMDTGINPDGDPDYTKKGTSITALSVGFLGMQPISFISRQLYLKVALGISSIDMWREETDDKNSRFGMYIDGGFRYVFSSDSKYNLNIGIDFSHSESFLKSSDKGYNGIGLRGIYPYVGIMW
jgi:hypothetical protein